MQSMKNAIKHLNTPACHRWLADKLRRADNQKSAAASTNCRGGRRKALSKLKTKSNELSDKIEEHLEERKFMTTEER